MRPSRYSRHFSYRREHLTRRMRWITHPITVFVSLQIVWLAITLIWVIWFVGEQAEIAQLAQKFGREYFDSGTALAILIVGCVLLGVLLFGTILLFVFGQRQSYLARQQRSFVSSVTHELKSPLASLQLAFETMMAHKLDEVTTSQLYAMVETDIDRLKRLIDQILVAGRLDQGAITFDEDNKAFDAGELIETICTKMSYLDPNVKKRLQIKAPAGIVLRGSKSAVTLIMNNLIENAIKYSPKDTPIIVSVDQIGHEIFLFVRDSGIGFERSELRRIFKMFHRGETAVKRAIPGTGLGLYIVNSAVRVLGGRVWVESPGRNYGSTFYVAIPAVSAAAQREDKESKAK